MRRTVGLLVSVMLPAVATAQPSAAITATPLPPPTVLQAPAPTDQAPQTQQPPQTQQTPQTQTQQTQQPQAPAEQPQPNTQLPMQLTWVPQGSAQLQVLDKVNAQSQVLNVKVGQQGQYGSLTIHVQACDTHPPDQPQDSAAYLTITDSHADEPGFQGWMLANEPSVAILQNPIYDVRVMGCRA